MVFGAMDWVIPLTPECYCARPNIPERNVLACWGPGHLPILFVNQPGGEAIA